MDKRAAMTKGKRKAAYMISAVAEQYEIHPQTLRLYEGEGLLAPSRTTRGSIRMKIWSGWSDSKADAGVGRRFSR
jgi:hypothetical protein